MSLATYYFSSLEDLAKHIEDRAKTEERLAKGCGPHIAARHNAAAAAFYEMTNMLRSSRIEGLK